MTALLRHWLRFNAVGLLGMAVQLGLLAALRHVYPGHVLLWSVVALEGTLLHNFIWHRRYTWRTHAPQAWWQQAVRFHAANGAVSLLGNLVLMRALTGRLPVVVANLVAILCCSSANFLLGQCWAFRPRHGSPPQSNAI